MKRQAQLSSIQKISILSFTLGISTGLGVISVFIQPPTVKFTAEQSLEICCPGVKNTVEFVLLAASWSKLLKWTSGCEDDLSTTSLLRFALIQ
jgi:hypothetical protein